MKKGYAQTSMREISKATGIDIRNLYYFIKSKTITNKYHDISILYTYLSFKLFYKKLSVQ